MRINGIRLSLHARAPRRESETREAGNCEYEFRIVMSAVRLVVARVHTAFSVRARQKYLSQSVASSHPTLTSHSQTHAERPTPICDVRSAITNVQRASLCLPLQSCIRAAAGLSHVVPRQIPHPGPCHLPCRHRIPFRRIPSPCRPSRRSAPFWPPAPGLGTPAPQRQ